MEVRRRKHPHRRKQKLLLLTELTCPQNLVSLTVYGLKRRNTLKTQRHFTPPHLPTSTCIQKQPVQHHYQLSQVLCTYKLSCNWHKCSFTKWSISSIIPLWHDICNQTSSVATGYIFTANSPSCRIFFGIELKHGWFACHLMILPYFRAALLTQKDSSTVLHKQAVFQNLQHCPQVAVQRASHRGCEEKGSKCTWFAQCTALL